MHSPRPSCPSNAEELGESHQLNVVQWPPKAVRLASITFHWPMSFFSKLLDEKCVSDVFSAAGFNWRLIFSAKGVSKAKTVQQWYASLFVESIEAHDCHGPHATFSLGTQT